MKWQMASRTAALSSTTRIHGVKGDGIKEETTSVSFLGQYEFSLISVYCALVAERHSAGVEQLRRESLPDPYQDFSDCRVYQVCGSSVGI
jgi:hypothetical protein